MLDCRQKSRNIWIADREELDMDWERESDMDCGQTGSQKWTVGGEGVGYGLQADKGSGMDC
jgi:hypothetical protein